MITEFLEQIEDRRERADALNIWKKAKRWGLAGLAAAAVVGTAFTSPYTIDKNSVAVLQRFGKYSGKVGPGLHFKLPFGMDKRTVVNVREPQTEEFGYRTPGLGTATPEELKGEYLMLTGDLGMADVEWIVQYDIKDPVAYTFNVKEPKNLLRDLSLSVNKQLIGDRSVDETITIGREEYEGLHKVELQKLLDECGSGMHVVALKLQSTNPPREVQPSFNDVSTAMQQKEGRVSEAMKEYNQVIPQATGDAQKRIEDAEGYRYQRVNAAKGDVLKFSKLFDQYVKATDITQQRMYYESISDFLSRAKDVTIMEQKGAEGGMLLKYDVNSLGGAK